MPLIKLYANLRRIAGSKEVQVRGATIQEMLGKLLQEFPDLDRFLMEDGRLRLRVVITINGQSMQADMSLQTPVSEHDQIAIFPPIAGG
jgi:molybdopterin synthase sulfur carrier subunit